MKCQWAVCDVFLHSSLGFHMVLNQDKGKMSWKVVCSYLTPYFCLEISMMSWPRLNFDTNATQEQKVAETTGFVAKLWCYPAAKHVKSLRNSKKKWLSSFVCSWLLELSACILFLCRDSKELRDFWLFFHRFQALKSRRQATKAKPSTAPATLHVADSKSASSCHLSPQGSSQRHHVVDFLSFSRQEPVASTADDVFANLPTTYCPSDRINLQWCPNDGSGLGRRRYFQQHYTTGGLLFVLIVVAVVLLLLHWC